MTTENRGGKREGAGRPKVKELRKNRTFRLLDDEYIKVKEYIKKIRKKAP
ncbi:hypothetical protein [Flavobacterium coralii]|tara:strand:+ start:479 stop:628 length:150 start_codon:yes stop_codon:yes gene_type:complete